MRALFVLKNDATVIIREATTQDALELNAVIGKIYGASTTVLTSLEEFQSMDSLNSQLQRIYFYQNKTAYLLLVAEIDGRIVGTLDFSNGSRQRNAHTGDFRMGVDPAFQNLGIGRHMIRVMLDWATKNPIIEKVKLTAFANNYNGLHLYKSLGFEEEGRGIQEIKMEQDIYLDVINMYKHVHSNPQEV
ncbi:MAG: N-acetyltransferase family protein [Aureispira sp.]